MHFTITIRLSKDYIVEKKNEKNDPTVKLDFILVGPCTADALYEKARESGSVAAHGPTKMTSKMTISRDLEESPLIF